MKCHIRRVGNSHGVIIPKALLEQIGIAAGDPVSIKINKKGRLVLTPLRAERPRAGWAEDSKALANNGDADGAWPARSGRAGKW